MIILYVKIIFWVVVAGIVLNVLDILKGAVEHDGVVFGKGLLSVLLSIPLAVWMFGQLWGGQ